MKKLAYITLFIGIVSLSYVAASDIAHTLSGKRYAACERRALDVAGAEGTDHYFSELDVCLSRK
jgi:hypothetical protein